MALEEGDGLNAEVITMPGMALLHLRAARFFSDRTKTLEADNAGQMLGAFWDEILYHATATVFASIAGLEAYANERFRSGARYDQLALADRQEARKEFYRKGHSLLEKFRTLVDKEEFGHLDTGREPYQSVGILIDLRDALVHFKPEQTAKVDHFGEIASAVTDEALHVDLSRKLKNKGIQPSQFFGVSEPLFPRGWANSSCTSWAVSSASALIKDFEQRTHRVVLSDRF